MDATARRSLVYALVAAAWVTVVAAAGQALHRHLPVLADARPARPAADAQVDVVKAPPQTLADRGCSTCTMGATRGLL